ncbi:YheC/YheD family protein [Tumebacillus flagellatus]|uniref:ATP-grasp domain-containing protein n=1 Tax=Tumebacillus flagellatus TaxID=1157490 RepID=A0A074LQ15_9BACL|nr:YheC/YheD family protein [Tumebacillus flagellatus]KEO84226.1 hypothetical protein EL26_05525 [Tumebacillus flagellatus]
MNQPNTNPSALVLSVSRKKLEEWGLQAGRTVRVRYGSVQGQAIIRRLTQGGEDSVTLQAAGDRIQWSQNSLSGRLVFSPGEGVQVGPVIGILTLGVKDDPKRPVGGRTKLLGSFVNAARELGALCFFFNASDVDWSQNLVRGVTLVQTGKSLPVWRMRTFPLPDVVYNRIPHRNGEIADSVVRAKKEFRSRGIPLFNERFVNKREMYAYMLEQDATKDLVPRTDRLRTADGLERFTRTHPYVYLKPIGGSLGMGILAVKRRADHYVTRYRKQGRHQTAKFREARSLYSFVKRYNPDRIYMMQEGIHLMQHDGSPTDFRVHMHKNGAGQWQVAGIGAKIAGKGAVTTHVHNGGHVLAGDVVLRDWYGDEAAAMRKKIEETSVRVAQTMEGMLQGPVGEWGLDVGIDESRRIWVFEANAKPGRAIFDHPDLQADGRRAAHLLIEYASLLANFPARREGGMG